MSTNRLRYALVVEGEYISAWQYLMLVRLQGLATVKLVAVLFRQAVAPSMSQRVNWLLLKYLYLIDGTLFQSPVTAPAARNILDLLPPDVVLCNADSPRYQRLLTSELIDVVIDLSRQSPSAELIAWATHGIWRYFYGYPALLGDCYVGMREYIQRQSEIISGVERILPNQATPEIIFYATTSTDQVSVSRSIERTLWKMADFMPQRLQELMQVGETQFSLNNQIRQADVPLKQEYAKAPPGIGVMLGVLFRYPYNFLNKLYKVIFRFEQWVLLIGQQNDATYKNALKSFRKLMPPRDRFWADPFVVEYQGEHYVFFEEFIYRRGIGHLACMQLRSDGSYSTPVSILQRPYHLSYPFVFAYQGQYYLIPETAENNTIELYRCVNFPHQWVFEKCLMTNVQAYDATLMEKEGRWWMFVSMRHHQHCSPSEALYLFHADSPLSTNWQAHPQNPVIARASQARPAGRIFEVNGHWYRPSQNCAGVYGRGLNINLIERLDKHHYQEATVSHVSPEGAYDLNGMHTLGIGSAMTVADAVHVHRRLGVLDRWLARFNRWQPPLFYRVGFMKRHMLTIVPLAAFWLDL